MTAKMTAKLKVKIKKLRKKRDYCWQQFCRLPKRNSISGLAYYDELNKVQQQLDELEGNKRSKRYCPEIDIEIIG